MFQSDNASLLGLFRKYDREAYEWSRLIVALALRESKILDDSWARNHPEAELSSRRLVHFGFQAELFAFCVGESERHVHRWRLQRPHEFMKVVCNWVREVALADPWRADCTPDERTQADFARAAFYRQRMACVRRFARNNISKSPLIDPLAQRCASAIAVYLLGGPEDINGLEEATSIVLERLVSVFIESAES